MVLHALTFLASSLTLPSAAPLSKAVAASALHVRRCAVTLPYSHKHAQNCTYTQRRAASADVQHSKVGVRVRCSFNMLSSYALCLFGCSLPFGQVRLQRCDIDVAHAALFYSTPGAAFRSKQSYSGYLCSLSGTPKLR